uniref:Uncharacterized protein n=1 Tax=Timema tahoe TaxID=61484 RepID=A0A7R9IJJ6_9NEOP|nr:unnamed protein product [Timema tahoe]
MEEKTFTVKIEPEDSLEYNLNQEMNLEIKTELGTPIKSEAVFKEELHDFEQLEYEPDSKSFPPIREDLDIGLKSSIKILGSLPDSNQDYESDKFQPLIIPVMKELQSNSECSNFTEQFGCSQVKIKSEISSLKPKRKRATCKEEGCSTYALKGGKCGKHGGTRNKCKYEGCCKYAKRRGTRYHEFCYRTSNSKGTHEGFDNADFLRDINHDSQRNRSSNLRRRCRRVVKLIAVVGNIVNYGNEGCHNHRRR